MMRNIFTTALFSFFFINSNGQLPISNFSLDDSVVCAGSCVSFTNLSTNATSYEWTFQNALPPTSSAVNPQGICYFNQGNFSVTLIASNASGSDTSTIYLNVLYPQPLHIFTSGDTIFADQGWAHYQWYLNNDPIPNDTLYYHVAMPDGTHFLECIDTNGCEAGLATFGPLWIPNFTPGDTAICAGTCVDFMNHTQWLSGDSAFATHQWYFNGATPSLSQDYSPQNICYNNAGTFLVKHVTLVGIDSGSDSVVVTVLPCTNVSEYSLPKFSISPNPFSSQLNLHFQSPQNSFALLKIFNTIGETVLEREINLEDQTLDLSSLPEGFYYLIIRNDTAIDSIKILKID